LPDFSLNYQHLFYYSYLDEDDEVVYEDEVAVDDEVDDSADEEGLADEDELVTKNKENILQLKNKCGIIS
jgi:hypothetical protein